MSRLRELAERMTWRDRQLHEQIYLSWHVFPKAMLHTAVICFLAGIAFAAVVAAIVRAGDAA